MSFQIFLKDNKSYTVTVNNNTTIQELKKFILDKLKIPNNHYYLTNGCRILDEEKMISEYSITSGNTINIVIRATGNRIQFKKN
tara:strand:+ start:751 stop:1002 length:252 start_codon:yes stop_codon:yes gene_type:complete